MGRDAVLDVHWLYQCVVCQKGKNDTRKLGCKAANLRYVSKRSPKPSWYGCETQRCSTQTVYEFDKLGPKITELTNRSAGTRKEIGDKAISLYVFREDAVDLTIIDLPGEFIIQATTELNFIFTKESLVFLLLGNPEISMNRSKECIFAS